MSNFNIPITVEIRQTLLPIDAEWLCDCLRQVLAAESVAAAELQVALVDDAEIQRINREFLGHDWATDVISFSYTEPVSACHEGWPRGQGRAIDGELILSVETALRQAPLHDWSPDAELLLYGVHGCLHLCGYDDLTDSERPLMRRREREVLALFGLVPRGLEDESLIP